MVYLANGVKVESVVDVSSLGALWPKATIEEARGRLGKPISVHPMSDGLHSVFSQGGHELVIVQREELSEFGGDAIPRWELRSYLPADSFLGALPQDLKTFLEHIGPRVHRVAVIEDNYRSIVMEFEAGRFRYLSEPLDRAAAGPSAASDKVAEPDNATR